MLTEEQILDNKNKFIDLLTNLNIDLTAITKYLISERVDYFNKPYNNYQSYAYRGSLCAHTIKLFEELKRLCDLYCSGRYSLEDILKVALFKDLYRAELYEPYYKNVKNEITGQWESVLSYRTKEIRPIFGDINFSSYMIAKKFINLDNDELVEAIMFSSSTANIENYNIRKTYKLVTLVSMAELVVDYL